VEGAAGGSNERERGRSRETCGEEKKRDRQEKKWRAGKKEERFF
jgi:hypothetical protein